MILHTVLVVVHVITAILGLGLTSALVVVTRNPLWGKTELLRESLKVIGIAMGLMILTGVSLAWVNMGCQFSGLWVTVGIVLIVIGVLLLRNKVFGHIAAPALILAGFGVIWVGYYPLIHWFWISYILFLIYGGLHGIGFKTTVDILKSGVALPDSPLLGKLRTMALWMAIIVMIIAVLMITKPFNS